jgi:hypothetical protein
MLPDHGPTLFVLGFINARQTNGLDDASDEDEPVDSRRDDLPPLQRLAGSGVVGVLAQNQGCGTTQTVKS